MWAAGRPLSRSEIIELSPKKTWKASSIHILLNSMLEKNAIQVYGFTKTGTHYGRTFVPVLSEAQYAAEQIQQLGSFKTDQAGTVTKVFSALLDESTISDETYQELERLLQERRTLKEKSSQRVKKKKK